MFRVKRHAMLRFPEDTRRSYKTFSAACTAAKRQAKGYGPEVSYEVYDLRDQLVAKFRGTSKKR